MDYYTMWVHQIKTPIAAMGLLLQGDETDRGRELLRQAEARAAARGDEIGQEAQAEAERLRREAEKRLDMAADLIVGRVVKD